MHIVLEDHIKELKYRALHVMFCILFHFVCLYIFRQELLFTLAHSLDRGLIFTSLSESFLNQIEMAAFFSLLLTIPYIIYQIWAFLRPGLYRFEVHFFQHLLRLSFLCYIMSWIVSYFVILPMAVNFLTAFEYTDPTTYQLEFYPRMSSFLSFVYKIMLSTLILFQIPILSLILYRFHLIHEDTMIRYRKYFLFLNFLLAAIFSPPDIGSQLILAIPMAFLYEAILLYFLYRKAVKRFV